MGKAIFSIFLGIILIFLAGLCAGLSGGNVNSNNYVRVSYNPKVVVIPTPAPPPTPNFIHQIMLIQAESQTKINELEAETENIIVLEQARHNNGIDWFLHLLSACLGGVILLMAESVFVLYFWNRRVN